MYNKKRRVNNRLSVMHMAALLFCLVLISVALLPGLYARYTGGDSGFDSARVISFKQLTVTENGDFVNVNGVNQFIFTPGVSLQKRILVSFGGSESATIVFIEVQTHGWETADHRNFIFDNGQMTWSINTNWEYLKTDGDTQVYYKHLAPNEMISELSVIQNDQINVSSNGTVEAYNNYDKDEIGITVTAYVAQSNGFSTEEEAWNSISKY